MVFFNLLFNVPLPWAGPDGHLDPSLQWQNLAADCGAQKGLQPQNQDMLSTGLGMGNRSLPSEWPPPQTFMVLPALVGKNCCRHPDFVRKYPPGACADPNPLRPESRAPLEAEGHSRTWASLWLHNRHNLVTILGLRQQWSQWGGQTWRVRLGWALSTRRWRAGCQD